MAPAQTPPTNVKETLPPRILLVEDEPDLLDTLSNVVAHGGVECRLVKATNLAEARRVIATQTIALLIADINLPDGDGLSLLGHLQRQQPSASAIVITGAPSIDGAITAMREGALDFLPKPFTNDQLIERMRRAMAHQTQLAKHAKKIDRLKRSVRRLNEARRLISQKVDLLCNDLITAYGELSKQFEGVRTQENFRKAIAGAKDLEQLLCHAMDWLLRQVGYCNVAVWLAADDSDHQLGAYMKYTVPGEPVVTDALRRVILPAVQREGVLHVGTQSLATQFAPAEMQHLKNADLLAVTCTYLGEALATVVLFRDVKSAFSADDEALVRAISPIFALSLASIVREGPVEDEGSNDSAVREDEEDRNRNKPRKPDPADWWKNGGDPPF